jgi:hypothetical protein
MASLRYYEGAKPGKKRSINKSWNRLYIYIEKKKVGPVKWLSDRLNLQPAGPNDLLIFQLSRCLCCKKVSNEYADSVDPVQNDTQTLCRNGMKFVKKVKARNLYFCNLNTMCFSIHTYLFDKKSSFTNSYIINLWYYWHFD